MQTLWQDIKYGTRMLLKNPGITAIVILRWHSASAPTQPSSALLTQCCCARCHNESDRLVFLNEKSAVLDEMSISYPNFEDWRTQTNL
jgi:hypothetical protein